MGRRRYSTYTQTDTPIVTVAETVVATVTGVSTDPYNTVVALRGEFTITTGATTTGLTVRVRRDSLTGAVVGEAETQQLETAAGSTEDHDFYVEDPITAEFIGRTYVLTVAPVAATANAAVLSASLEAEVSP